MRSRPTALLFIFVLFVSVHAGGNSAEELAKAAVSDDASVSASAIAELRTRGPKGLDAVMAEYAADIDRFVKTGESSDKWKRISSAIDAVAMQKDAYASGLYWYTDLDQAKKAAKDRNRPILSLRLLGNLNEEFSCANSRFFRALLYSNSNISKYLSENYILHWRSVRPAPKVTIDFGDGRKIERTLTGNSIHYILDEKGRIVDAIPGLYSPEKFLAYLTDAAAAVKTIDAMPGARQPIALMRYRKTHFDAVRRGRDTALKVSGVTPAQPAAGNTAFSITNLAVTKMVTEESILRLYDTFAQFEPRIELSDWKKLAAVYAPPTEFDRASLAFVRRQNRELSEAEFAQLIANLKTYVALDTTRNDFLFHQKLYEWMNNDPAAEVDSFNTRVYADVFKTPDSDKWLGLYSTDVYTALDGGGVTK